MDFQIFGVSVEREIIGVKSFPEIGSERTIQGYDTLLYRETAIHRLFRISVLETTKVGKRKNSRIFDKTAKYDQLLINSIPAICQFDKARKKAPYSPAATCLLDNASDGTFDEIMARRSGAADFKSGGEITPVTYEKEEYVAEMFFQDGKMPLPGIGTSVIGWDENGARVIGGWLYPSESLKDTLSRPGGSEAAISRLGSGTIFDQVILFPQKGEAIDLFGMRFAVLDPQWKTLKYRVDKGYGVFNQARTD